MTAILEILAALWKHMLAGALLVLIGAGTGMAFGRVRSVWPVRAIDWWVRHLVVPLVAARSWTKRTGMIFLNNASVLAAVLALGRWQVAALVAVTTVGVALGIAMRVLTDHVGAGRLATFNAYAPKSPVPKNTKRACLAYRIGMALNLVELPAIVITVGMSLGRQAADLAADRVWTTFGCFVVPALLIAAAGEALWLGVLRRPGRSGQEHPASDDDAQCSGA